MGKLVIVESPAKCKKIEEYLGHGYNCVASYGHLTSLPDLKSISIENNYKPTYVIIKDKHKTISKLQKAIAESNEIILATDDDREGEAIAWHICQLFNLSVKHTPRIIFHEITKAAINEAIKNPRKINIDLVYSQQTRQILDIFVGFKYTPLLWKHISPLYKDGLSSGRCQTPTLRMIYDNAIEIKKAPGEATNTVHGYFTKHNIKFDLNKTINDEDKLIEFLNLSQTFEHKLKRGVEKELLQSPPSPLSTSLLQQKCSSIHNLSPKDTMKVAQKLYEKGLITYMRTDSKHFSKEFCDKTKTHIKANFGDEFVGSKNIENNDKTAHEAIRPTNINDTGNDSSLTQKEIRVYKTIWKTTVQSLMSESRQLNCMIQILSPCEHYYQYSSSKSLFKGWKILDKEDNTSYFDFFEVLNSDNTIEYNKIQTNETILHKKQHLSYANLVKLLEEKGIGRPSTYASIIEKNITRGYINIEDIPGDKKKTKTYILEDGNIKLTEKESIIGAEKKKIVIQSLGVMVIEFLICHVDNIFDYEYTNKMEIDLDNIASKTRDHTEVCDKYWNSINDNINNMNIDKNYKLSYKINQYDVIVGKYGVTVKDSSNNFYKMKKDVCPFKLKNNEYALEDIVEVKLDNNLLGKYNSENIYVKEGKYGKYLAWGKNTKSLEGINCELCEENIKQIIEFIEKKTENKNVVREIDDNVSIRNGKYGMYIFYKTSKMKKPTFLKLYGCPFIDSIKVCDKNELKIWIQEKYNI